ncbi:hypothetical protein GCU56_17705 [Geodermatophilus sabuli]|uniref:Uncharacterized protein n=1 Tax=Geodermatophilus sabuli TaxID=1564158 RepID=A0A7K3W497_9ACTN|nr:hypothetical protein [Geodermatophilus sabuli]NEK59696.1 hypothetical protein [Geodermatophilus sabuli]
MLTTVPAGALRAVAAEARSAVARLTRVQRPHTQLSVLDDPLVSRRVHDPVSSVGSAIATALSGQP